MNMTTFNSSEGKRLKILRMWLLTCLLVFKTSVAYVQTFGSLDDGLLKYLKNFSVNSRPIDVSNSPVNVNISMEIVRLDAVSEKRQSVRMKIHVNYMWQNPYLKWIPKDYENVSEVILPKSEIWTPPIHLFNEASKSKEESDAIKYDKTVLLMYDGMCSLTYAQFFKSTCEIDVSDFPFDEQYCHFIFGSWSMDKRLLILNAANKNAVSYALYKENGEWELAEAVITSESVKYPIHRQEHSTIKLAILIRRKHFFFMMNLMLPCVLIACMIFLVFVLPAKSGERISLGITVMLSMAIFQELSSEKLPSSSDNYPLLGIYYTTSMFEIGIALVVNCFILNVFYREYEMAPWVRRLLFDKLARFVRIDVPNTRKQHYLEKLNLSEVDYMDATSETMITNPNTHENENGLVNGHNDLSNYYSRTQRDTQTLNNRPKKLSIVQNGTDINFNNASITKEISKKMSLSDLSIRNEERKLHGEDWKIAARIIDRIMLFLAVSVGVLSFIIIFLHARRFREMFQP